MYQSVRSPLERLGKVIWEGNIKMNPRETDCKDGRWMKLVHNSIELWYFVLLMMNLRVSESNSVSKLFTFVVPKKSDLLQ
jgi:hypothetical protein